MGYCHKVIPYTFLPVSPLSPSFLILSVPLLKSIGCQSCLLQSALSSRWFLTKNADSSRKLLHIKQVTGAFSEEFCLSIYQAHTQFTVSAALQKLLDIFVRGNICEEYQQSGCHKRLRELRTSLLFMFYQSVQRKTYFSFLIKKKRMYCNVRKADLVLMFLPK